MSESNAAQPHVEKGLLVQPTTFVPSDDAGPGGPPSAATICAECKALLPASAVYHPRAFCVLVKAGIDPEDVVHKAVRYYDRHGWPESKGASRV